MKEFNPGDITLTRMLEEREGEIESLASRLKVEEQWVNYYRRRMNAMLEASRAVLRYRGVDAARYEAALDTLEQVVRAGVLEDERATDD